MQLGWIDYSKDERNKITSILRLLGTQTALDELGIGTVRDGFSDLLFPGISTIQTRAKYFVLIPYLYTDAEKHKFNRYSEVRTWISKQEERLIKTLVENSGKDEDGIIGSRTYKQGKTLKIKPSSIYWNGLRRTGILRQSEFSIDNACEIAFVHSKKRSEISLKAEGDNESGDDRDVLNDGLVLFSPILPDYDYMSESTIELTQYEAIYLLEHFIQSEGTEKSLMAYMLSHHLLFDNFFGVDTDVLPERLRYIVSLAQDFASFIYGAHILYNVIYSEGSDAEMTEVFSEWKDKEYRAVNLDAIITVSSCPRHTGDFLRRFDHCINSDDIEAAKQAVIDREKYIKRDRAKLCKPDQYRYETPIHYYKLDYRYSTAATIMTDIYEGLGEYYGASDV
ncbi:MAG: DUF6361 family protein [Desulfosporosinus sp.]